MQTVLRGAAHRSIRLLFRMWAKVAMRGVHRAGAQGERSTPQRILLMNGAHVGDLVISTCLLPVLRSAYPTAEFGFLTGGWSSMVVREHPEIAFTHQIDHWRLNRATISWYAKLVRFRETRRTALRQIRETGYDMSVSVHCWFPDFLYLAWQAGIPERLGFRHSWFAPFATLTAEFPREDFVPQGARMSEVLRPLGLDESHLRRRHSFLAPSTEAAKREVCDVLGVEDLDEARYMVVHVGSGEPARELLPEFWRVIAKARSAGRTLLFTGKGLREQLQIGRIIEGLDGCVPACELSWSGFVAAVRYAEMLYGVESMAGHVAAAVGTPCRVIYSGTAGVARWRPEGEGCMVFTQHVPCAPCGVPGGCEPMTCLRDVTPESVLKADDPMR